jgi:hypothetical protein
VEVEAAQMTILNRMMERGQEKHLSRCHYQLCSVFRLVDW